MKRKFIVFSVILSIIFSICSTSVVMANEENLVIEEWKYSDWGDWNYYNVDKKLDHSSKFLFLNIDIVYSEDIYEREYLGSYCSSWTFIFCNNIDYKYRERSRDKWYETAKNYKTDNVWFGNNLYEVTNSRLSTLDGFEKKEQKVSDGYYKTIGYAKKEVTKYNSWSEWKNYSLNYKLSDSSDWFFGSKKYSTSTYEREYLGSKCVQRKWFSCKKYEYKYRERTRTSYLSYEDDMNKPIKQYIEPVYKIIDDYSKPIYNDNYDYKYENSKVLYSLEANVIGISHEGVYKDNVVINWSNDSSQYGITYRAKLNGKDINRNTTVSQTGVYFLDIVGSNGNFNYTQTIMFAILKDNNKVVVDYKDEFGSVIYREILANGQESAIVTYGIDGNYYINVDKNKENTTGLSYRTNNSTMDNTSDYAHNRFYNNLTKNNAVGNTQLLFAGTTTLVGTGILICALVLYAMVETNLAMSLIDNTSGISFGSLPTIEEIFEGVVYFIVSVGEVIADFFVNAWDWITGWFETNTATVVNPTNETFPNVENELDKSLSDIANIIATATKVTLTTITACAVSKQLSKLIDETLGKVYFIMDHVNGADLNIYLAAVDIHTANAHLLSGGDVFTLEKQAAINVIKINPNWYAANSFGVRNTSEVDGKGVFPHFHPFSYTGHSKVMINGESIHSFYLKETRSSKVC